MKKSRKPPGPRKTGHAQKHLGVMVSEETYDWIKRRPMGASQMCRRLLRLAQWQEENPRKNPATLYHDRYADPKPGDGERS